MATTIRPPGLSPGQPSFPPRLVAGIGCNRGTGADEIIALILAMLATAGASAESLCAIGTLERKAGEPGLLAAAAHFGVPLRLFAADELEAWAALSPSRSRIVEGHVGVANVAEAVALKAGSLLVPKRKSAHATCAIGVCGGAFDLAAFGRPAVPSLYSPNAEIASSMLATSSAGP